MNRKSYDAEFRQRMVKEAKETGNASLVGRKYGVNLKTISRWVIQARTEKGEKVKKGEKREKERVEMGEARQQISQLKNLLGERELEIAILRDLLKKTTLVLPQRLT